jgi:carbamoyl-phosphate synthase large subunit
MQVINEQAALIAQPGEFTEKILRKAKSDGFSDAQIADLRNTSEEEIRSLRHRLSVRPVFKTVDTCAAEFEAFTPYYYSSYEEENEVGLRTNPAVIILGSCPNRIGQ